MGAATEHLTERQKKWFATIQANLQDQTGKSVEEWAAIARTCPHQTPRARSDWLRAEHGLGVNHAAYVLSQAYPGGAGWDDPDALRTALWKDTSGVAVLKAVERMALTVDGLVVGQRKSFTSFSRSVQFAAMRPLKTGGALLGLKLDPALSPRLSAPTRKESWSERLTAGVELPKATSVDDDIARLFREAAKHG
ncbi:MAG TPA: DUF4287 domain-containing protein [Caulobacteraceae bacterium]|jgi:hypothetical protein